MITIEKALDAETKEVYSFHLFDLNAVFNGYDKLSKPKGKRIWRSIGKWSSHNDRYSTIPQPELPPEIILSCRVEIQKMIRVMTWQEYKNP